MRMALLDEAARAVSIVRLDCPEGRFPSVGRVHPPAIRPGRAGEVEERLESPLHPSDLVFDHPRLDDFCRFLDGLLSEDEESVEMVW